MDINEQNLKSLAEYLTQTLSPDVNIRNPAEQFLQSIEGTKNYPLLLLRTIDNVNLELTIRIAASIAFKNYIKRNWSPNSEVDIIHIEDRVTVKSLIINLMLSSPDAIQKQLSDAVSVIGKHDFPYEWPVLLDELIEKFSTGNFAIINGALQTAHSLFRKYRHEFKSQKLWSEIKIVLDKFTVPLTELFKETIRVAENETTKEGLVATYNCLLLISKIFYSLNFQDLPEFFEDNMALWMEHFHSLLSKDVPALRNQDDEEAGLIEQLRSQICDNVAMYAQKYDEEFAPYMPQFVTAIWNLLTSTGSQPKYDTLVCNALKFLATVADRKQYQSLFEEPTVLSGICEKVIVPNMEFRVADEELFEDNPEEYIRRDIEGSDVDTRRRGACDLVKVLSKFFEEKITPIFGSYIELMLQNYAGSAENWKNKDAAVYLVTSIAAKGQTQLHGVTKSSSLVNINEFAVKHIIVELEGANVDAFPVIKADCIKYIMTFRSLLSREIVVGSLPLMVRFLHAKSVVVRIYAASTIEKILAMKEPDNNKVNRIKADEFAPISGEVLNKLLSAMTIQGSEESEYIMKAIMRSICCLQEKAIPLIPDLLTSLTSKLLIVAKNPSRPHFNHFLFETLALSIKVVCRGTPEGVNALESILFPPFGAILQENVAEFVPYILQLVSMLVEHHNVGSLPEWYVALYPHLLSPALWEPIGNVHPGVRLLSAYIKKCKPSEIVEKLNLMALLGLYQRLIVSPLRDKDAFKLIRVLVEHCPNELLTPYIKQVFVLLFQRISTKKTSNFVRGMIVFLCFYTVNFGASNLISVIDGIQAQMFGMVVDKVIQPDAKNVILLSDKKVVAVGITKLICEAKELIEGAYSHLWIGLLRSLLFLFESADEIKDADDDDKFEDIDVSYDIPYSKLVYAAPPEYDPLQGIGDLRIYLAQSLSKLSEQYPGKLKPLVDNGLTVPEKEVLNGYFSAASVQMH